jgi:hypothetical protein
MVWVKKIFVTRQEKALKDTIFLIPFIFKSTSGLKISDLN